MPPELQQMIDEGETVVEVEAEPAELEAAVDIPEPEAERAEPRERNLDNRARMLREYKNSILLVRKWRSVPLHYPTWVGLLVVGVAFYFAALGAEALDEVYWGTRVSFSIAACVWCFFATPSKFDWVVALTTPICYYVGVGEDTYGLNYPYVSLAIIVGELNLPLGVATTVFLMLITKNPLRFALTYVTFQNKKMNEVNCLPTILLSPLRDVIMVVYSIITCCFSA